MLCSSILPRPLTRHLSRRSVRSPHRRPFTSTLPIDTISSFISQRMSPDFIACPLYDLAGWVRPDATNEGESRPGADGCDWLAGVGYVNDSREVAASSKLPGPAAWGERRERPA